MPPNTARAAAAAKALMTAAPDAAPELLVAVGVAIADSEPASALAFARHAGAAGHAAALGLLDRLEAGKSLPEIRAMQADATLSPAPATLAGLRRAALAHATGLGAARHYEQALTLAMLLSAAHDATGAALMADFEGRFGADPAWPALRAAAETAASTLWVTVGYPAKLTRP